MFLPAHALPERVRRIQALGATTRTIDGTYDDAVRLAAAEAERNGWILVSDTSDDPRDPATRHVMAGYAQMVDEALDAMERPPSHAFLQAGVGTMAGAVAGRLAQRLGGDAPRIVLVEPADAACVLESLEADAPTDVPGPFGTVMDCLAAGRVSRPAWPILRQAVRAAIAIPDEDCRRTLERHRDLRLGPSGVTGLAGLEVAARDPQLRELIGTEERLPA